MLWDAGLLRRCHAANRHRAKSGAGGGFQRCPKIVLPSLRAAGPSRVHAQGVRAMHRAAGDTPCPISPPKEGGIQPPWKDPAPLEGSSPSGGIQPPQWDPAPLVGTRPLGRIWSPWWDANPPRTVPTEPKPGLISPSPSSQLSLPPIPARPWPQTHGAGREQGQHVGRSRRTGECGKK